MFSRPKRARRIAGAQARPGSMKIGKQSENQIGRKDRRTTAKFAARIGTSPIIRALKKLKTEMVAR
jgi:hypothetical protein